MLSWSEIQLPLACHAAWRMQASARLDAASMGKCQWGWQMLASFWCRVLVVTGDRPFTAHLRWVLQAIQSGSHFLSMWAVCSTGHVILHNTLDLAHEQHIKADCRRCLWAKCCDAIHSICKHRCRSRSLLHKRTCRQFAICQCPFVINAEDDRHARLSSKLQRMDCFVVGLLMKCAHVCCPCSSGPLPNSPLSFSSTVTGTFVLPHGHAVVVQIDCMVMALW